MSLSIGDDSIFDVVRTFINSVIRFLDISPTTNCVGKILFARHASISFNVQEHHNEDDLTAAIDSISIDAISELNRTGTNMPEALDLMRTAGQSGGELMFRDDDTVTRIAVFITDGRPNTKDLTGNARQQDAQNTEDAAARLHESGVYDQIYAIGIEGNRNINFRELEFIASDPSLVFIVQDFDAELFEELENNLTSIFCGRKYVSLQKMFGFPITLNIWKDIGNTIFPNGFINFPKFWKDGLSTTFQLLERPDFITFPNWKWMEMYYWKYTES